jgi:hypothetical protein
MHTKTSQTSQTIETWNHTHAIIKESLCHFGEIVPWYEVRVLNEREARAASWLLFTGALISFIQAFQMGNFVPIKIFITLFMIDFIIRVLINPAYAPTMILGRIATAHQNVEYVWAPQKRFARALWLVLSIVMFGLMVIGDVVTPINIRICLLCLTLLFFETVFGICLWCIMYTKLTKNTAQYCPWWVCEMKVKKPIQHVSFNHLMTVVVVTAVIFGVFVLFIK